MLIQYLSWPKDDYSLWIQPSTFSGSTTEGVWLLGGYICTFSDSVWIHRYYTYIYIYYSHSDYIDIIFISIDIPVDGNVIFYQCDIISININFHEFPIILIWIIPKYSVWLSPVLIQVLHRDWYGDVWGLRWPADGGKPENWLTLQETNILGGFS